MNTLPFSSPNNTALSDVLGIDSPHTAIFKAKTQILEVLEQSPDSLAEISRIFLSIQDLVQKLRSEILYDYQDYEERLLVSDDTLRACIDKTPLPGLVQQILDMFDDVDLKDSIKDRLWTQLFNDLAYEMLEPDRSKYKELDLSQRAYRLVDGNSIAFCKLIEGYDALNLSSNDLEHFDEGRLRCIFENVHSIDHINLSMNYLNHLKEGSFDVMFYNLQHIQSIDLGYTSSENDNYINGLRMIFSYVRGAKIIHLNGWYLEEYPHDYLKTSFQYIKKLRHLSLRACGLHNMSGEQLNAIFSELSLLKSLDVGDNNFSHFDEGTLQNMFKSLPNLKSLGLSVSHLDTMSSSQLESMFSSLHHLRKIDFCDTDIAFLDDEKIRCIFGHLTSIKTINLSYCRLFLMGDQKIELMFRFLTKVNKIIINETDKWVIDLIGKFPELHGKIVIAQ